MFCSHCGATLAPGATYCSTCGAQQSPGAQPPFQRIPLLPPAGDRGDWIQPSASSPDPTLVLVLNLCCIAGLGQMLVGQGVKGLVVFIACVVLGMMTGGTILVVLLPAMAYDAYTQAMKLRSGRPIRQWDWF